MAEIKVVESNLQTQIIECISNLLEESDRNRMLSVLKEVDEVSIRIMFRKVFPGSQNAFCKKHQIKNRNFSDWLAGKRSSVISAKMTREWLLNIVNGEDWIPPIISDELSSLRSTKSQVSNTNWKPISSTDALDILKIRLQILSESNTRSLQRIIFVDADNCSYVLNYAHQYVTATHRSDIHIVAVFSPLCKHSKSICKLFGMDWFSFVTTTAPCPDAADRVINMLASMLHMLTLTNPISIIIISGDSFARYLASSLRNHGSECFHLNPKRCPDNIFSHDFDIKSIEIDS
jgi:hypothetical protein